MKDSPDYIIRQPTEADGARLREFSSQVLPDLPEDFLNQRWWWHQDPNRTLVAEHVKSGQIAGMCAARIVQIWNQGEVTPGIAISDWYVSPNHSGRSLGKRLLGQQMQGERIVTALGVTAVAAENFMRVGWESPISVPLYLALFPRLMAALRGWRSTPYEVDVHRVGHGDPIKDQHIDALWASCDKSWPMMMRDSREMRRHLSLMPRHTYTLVLCYEQQQPVGYMLSRLMPPGAIRKLGRMRVATIVDFLIDPRTPAAFDRMLVTSIRDLGARGASAAIIRATAPELKAKLPGYGFISARTPLVGRMLKNLETPYMYWVGNRPKPGSRWYLTLADCDQDFSRGSTAGGRLSSAHAVLRR